MKTPNPIQKTEVIEKSVRRGNAEMSAMEFEHDAERRVLESRIESKKSSVDLVSRAHWLFQRLAWSFWGGFFVIVGIFVFDTLSNPDNTIYVVALFTILAVGSYWWSEYLRRVLCPEAQQELAAASADLEYFLWKTMHVESENREESIE